MKHEVFTPAGSENGSNKYHYARRLENLNGKTVGEISNRLWESDKIFPLIRDLLKRQFPDIKFVPYTEFPSGTDNIIDNEDLGRLVISKNCDAVIGSGAA